MGWSTIEVRPVPELYWARSRTVFWLSVRAQLTVPEEFSSARTWSTAGPQSTRSVTEPVLSRTKSISLPS